MSCQCIFSSKVSAQCKPIDSNNVLMDRFFRLCFFDRLSLAMVTRSKTFKYTAPIMNLAEGHGVGTCRAGVCGDRSLQLHNGRRAAKLQASFRSKKFNR